MSVAMYADHTARKRHRCDAGFMCVKADPEAGHSRETPLNWIEPGERYTAVTVPPWVLTQEDPDSPPTKLGRWFTQRFHLTCEMPTYY